jgi:hypothetical protein
MRITRLTVAALLMLAAGIVSLAVGGWACAAFATSPDPAATAPPQAVRAPQKPAKTVAQPAPDKAPARRLRVLLFACGPTRDCSFLLFHLAREVEDKKLDLSIHQQTFDHDLDEKSARILKTFPTRLSAIAKKEKPADLADNLAAYDVIVAIDPDWTQLTKDQLQLLKKWAGMKGRGLILLAGGINTHQLAQPDLAKKLQPVRDLLPVELADDRSVEKAAVPARPFALRFPKPEKFLKLDEEGKDPLGGWSEFFFGKARADWQKTEDQPRRGFYGPYPVKAVKPGATVVAVVRTPKAEGKSQEVPYLVTMRHGKGRVVYLGSGETWRLRTFRGPYYERFWGQLLRYAASPVPAR